MPPTTTRDAVQAVLADVDFPADKDVLVETAARNGADDETLRALRAVPPVDYGGVAEVLRSVRLRDESDAPPPRARAAARQEHTRPGLSEQSKDIPTDDPLDE